LFGEGTGVVSPAQSDRRTAPRLDKVFPVYVEGDGGTGVGVARNLSEGGMFIELRDPQPLGSQVRILFPSDGGEMAAVGEVRYVCHLMGRLGNERDPQRVGAIRGMGVRFLYFEPGGTYHGLVH
jgi:hypothetical protein